MSNDNDLPTSSDQAEWKEDLFGATKTWYNPNTGQTHSLSRGSDAHENATSDLPHRHDIRLPDGRTNTHYTTEDNNHIRYNTHGGYEGMKDAYKDATGDDA